MEIRSARTARTALLFAAAALASAGCASLRPGSSVQGLELPIEKAAIRLAADAREGGYRLVSTEEMKKRLDEGGKLVVIDTLPAPDRAATGHIPGSVNAPMPKDGKELAPADVDRLLAAAGPDKGVPVVLYCGFVACRRSHVGAKALAEKGYEDVIRYPGGIVAWAEAGHPLER
jgi:rhodanese-related sulfurtransferase